MKKISKKIIIIAMVLMLLGTTIKVSADADHENAGLGEEYLAGTKVEIDEDGYGVNLKVPAATNHIYFQSGSTILLHVEGLTAGEHKLELTTKFGDEIKDMVVTFQGADNVNWTLQVYKTGEDAPSEYEMFSITVDRFQNHNTIYSYQLIDSEGMIRYFTEKRFLMGDVATVLSHLKPLEITYKVGEEMTLVVEPAFAPEGYDEALPMTMYQISSNGARNEIKNTYVKQEGDSDYKREYKFTMQAGSRLYFEEENFAARKEAVSAELSKEGGRPMNPHTLEYLEKDAPEKHPDTPDYDAIEEEIEKNDFFVKSVKVLLIVIAFTGTVLFGMIEYKKKKHKIENDSTRNNLE